MSLRALLLLVLAAASCDAYAPSFTACTVQCGPGGACPGGWECAADSYCHPAGDGALCACADACTAAAAQCVGNGRQRCVAGAGCRQWGALEACPPAAPYCSGAGQCGASCEDECAAGTRRCTSGGYQGCGTSAGHPCLGWSPEVGCASGEVCRAADGACVADCGGQPCPCRAGETQACADRGECRGGVRQCVDGEFGPCEWQVGPTPEECDGKDNDCNGTPDDGLAAPVCGEQRGVCAGAFERCGGAAGWVGCTAADYAAHAASQSHTYQGTESLCDGEDNDCDGTVDEPTQCCQPDCAGKACGADDGCGHPCPTGSCGANASCVSGACQCVNASCGGSCCGAGQVCAGTTCCTPSCNGKACGADDGCGRPCQTGSCGPAPAATCLNATTLRTYSGAGTCAGGTCSYTSTDTSCANGCSNGACTAAVTCSAGMVLIPAGPFMMGSAAGAGQTDEQPLHQVTLSGYCLDVTEVTNGQWRACVSGGGCAAPADSSSYTRSSYYGNATYDNYPVINIDWNQAQAYCAWAGKRLPTEAEWEKGARGGCEVVAPASCGGEDDRLYPWGDGAPTCSLANYYGCDGDTDSVGARPSGASPYGFKDMAGNVWEWVADWYSASYYGTSPSTDPSGPTSGTARVMRGGSWGSDTGYVRVANRDDDDPTFRYYDVGLRCARTP